MKKNIDLLKLETSDLKELMGSLSGEDNKAAHELSRGITDLISGRSSAVVIDVREGGGEPADTALRIGDLEIDFSTRSILKNGKSVYLTPKEYDILSLLVNNRGQIFSKEEIYRSVWGSDYCMDDSNIMAFIRKLRKKIETDPDSPKYILTVWGIGYRFSGDIQV